MLDPTTDAGLIRQIVEWTEELDGPKVVANRTEQGRINYRRELPRVSQFGEQIAWVMNRWPDERKHWPGRPTESSAVHEGLFESVRVAWRIEQSRLWQQKVIRQFELGDNGRYRLSNAQLAGVPAQATVIGSTFDFRDDIQALNAILEDILALIRAIKRAIRDAIMGVTKSARIQCQKLIEHCIGEMTAIRFEQLTAEVLLQSFYNQCLGDESQSIVAPDWNEGHPPIIQAATFKEPEHRIAPVTLYKTSKYASNRGSRFQPFFGIDPKSDLNPETITTQIATGPLFESLYAFLATGRAKQRLGKKVFEWECPELLGRATQKALQKSSFPVSKAELMADAFDLFYHLAMTYIDSSSCSSGSKMDENIFALPLQLSVNQFAEFRGLRSSNATVRNRHKAALEALGSVRLIRTGRKPCDAFVIDWQNSPTKSKLENETKASSITSSGIAASNVTSEKGGASNRSGASNPKSSKNPPPPVKHFSFLPGSILASCLRPRYEDEAVEAANQRIISELNCAPSTYREPVQGAHYSTALWALKPDSYRQLRQLLRVLRLDWREHITGYVCLDIDHADYEAHQNKCTFDCVGDKCWRTWGELFDRAGINFFASYAGHHARAITVWLKLVRDIQEPEQPVQDPRRAGHSRSKRFIGRHACQIDHIAHIGTPTYGKLSEIGASDSDEFLAKRVWLPPTADIAEKLRLSGYRQGGNQKSAVSKQTNATRTARRKH